MHEQEYNAQWKQCCLPAIGSRSAVCFFSASFRFRPNRQWTMMGGWKVFVCLFLWRGWGGGFVSLFSCLFFFCLFFSFAKPSARAKSIKGGTIGVCVRFRSTLALSHFVCSCLSFACSLNVVIGMVGVGFESFGFFLHAFLDFQNGGRLRLILSTNKTDRTRAALRNASVFV